MATTKAPPEKPKTPASEKKVETVSATSTDVAVTTIKPLSSNSYNVLRKMLEMREVGSPPDIFEGIEFPPGSKEALRKAEAIIYKGAPGKRKAGASNTDAIRILKDLTHFRHDSNLKDATNTKKTDKVVARINEEQFLPGGALRATPEEMNRLLQALEKEEVRVNDTSSLANSRKIASLKQRLAAAKDDELTLVFQEFKDAMEERQVLTTRVREEAFKNIMASELPEKIYLVLLAPEYEKKK